MKLTISRDGFLVIERKGLISTEQNQFQTCPFAAFDKEDKKSTCGHWCPGFREPKKFLFWTYLKICSGYFFVLNKNFYDERINTRRLVIK